MAPTWTIRNAYCDLDFVNGRYYGGSWPNRTNFPGGLFSLSNGAASNAYGAVDTSGLVWIFTSNQPRVVPRIGMMVESSRINRLLHSRDLTQAAWVATNVTTARNQTGADRLSTANTATLLTATASNGTVLQSITLASSQVITSFFVKRSVGTGTIEITQDGGATYTDITSQINSSTFTRVNTSAATITNPQVGFRIATSGDAIIVDFTQTEQAPSISSPTITDSSTRGRGSEMPMFGTTGTSYNDGQRVISNIHYGRIPISMYAEFTGDFNTSTVANILGGGNNAVARIQISVTGNAEFRTTGTGSAIATANTVTAGRSNVNKVAVRCNGDGASICLNGGVIATSTGGDNSVYMGAAVTDDHIGLGNRGAGDQALNGALRRIAYSVGEFSDAELKSLTLP